MKHFSSKGIGKAVGAWRRLLAGAALLMLAPTAQAQLFGTAATFSSGAGGAPVGVAMADFDADGRPDVATANNATNTVAVLLGAGTGSLGAAATYGTGAGSAPQWVAAADLNGDGRPDLVTANTGTNQVGVLLNNGNGTFGAVATYGSGAGSAPLGLTLADLNADGNPDIVTANNGSNTIGVLLNAGGGSFGTVVTYATGTGTAPLGVAMADLNGDGRPDVVTANSGNSTASVLLSSGPGTFSAAAAYGTGAGSTPNGVALADLNADGKPDLVTANTGSNTIGTLLNSGTGTFGTVTTTSTGAGSTPAAIALADVNADGRPDAVVALNSSNAVGVLLGSGPGTFSAVTTYSAGPGSAPLALTLADLNGDALPDIVSNNNGSNTVGVLLNQNATATITSFAPTTSRAGGTVTVTGTGLAGATGVTVNGTAGIISGTPTNTSLSFVVGAGSSTGLIRISTAGGSATSSTSLTVIPTPTLTSTTPTVGATGTVLTVTGTDLQNPSAVTFTGVGGTFGAAAGYSANAAGTTLSNVVVPSGLQPGNATFTVSTPGGTTNALSFLVSLPPVITSFAPASGQAGATITLTGSRLADVTDVTVNGVSAAFTLGTATSLSFTVPTGTGTTQQVVLTSPGGTSVPSTAFTAQLRVTSTNPAPALNTALVTSSALSTTFSEPVTAASAQNLRVFSSQVGGRKAGNVTVSRSTATFRSSLPGSRADFKPGELVEVTVPATIANASGLTVSKKVYQFRTAVGATGTGNFAVASTPSVSSSASNVCVGDLDGDGDLDMATSGSYSNSVGIRFNDGAGNYSGGRIMTFDGAAGLAMGDLDGDGDLDLAVSQVYQQGSSTLPVGWATILLNDGSGNFSSNGTVSLGTGSAPTLAFGDIDGDGDLDLVAALRLYSELAIRFNNGSGSFSGSQNLSAFYPQHVVLADMDSDGDLDIVQDVGNGGNGSNSAVSIVFNNGSGTFAYGGAGSEIGSSRGVSVAVGDMDGDGDLDIATCTSSWPGTAIIWKNNGDGTFPAAAASASALGGAYASDVKLADVDGDGDLDLLGASSGALSVRLNNGNGVIGGGQTLSRTSGSSEDNLTTGDVDGDGDLDVLLESSGATMNVFLNGAAAYPAITSFTPPSGAPGASVTITGVNLAGATSVRFNGTVSTAIANNTATSLMVNVPAGATNGYLSVTTATGTSAPSSTIFIVVLPPTLTSFTPTSGPVGTSVTITGTNFTGATGVSFNATAATSFVVNSNTSITATVPAGATTGTISVQALGGTVTSTGTFTVIQPPVLSSISPGSGPTGVGLTLTGTTLTGTTGITFAGSPNNTVSSGFIINPAGTQISGIIVPAGAISGPVTVTTPVGTSNSLTFTLTSALAVTAVSPTINNRAAGLTSPSQVTFSLPLAAGAENGLRVHSTLRGGLLTRGTTPAVRSGNTLTYTPTQPYQAGEVVSVSVTSAAMATGGETLLRSKVYQFRTGVSTGGRGLFQLGADHSVGTGPLAVVTADVDNDGDQDMLVGIVGGPNGAGVNVRLNNGNGTSFSTSQTLAGANSYIATGDVDGDGDVDFVGTGSSSALVRLNNGNGVFTNGQTISYVTGEVVLADMDGDGDLDLVSSDSGGVGVSLNDGSGTFGGGQGAATGSSSRGLVVGDLDNDGDLDALSGTFNYPAYVYVLTNNGYGALTKTQTVTVNDYAYQLSLGDVDGDGDLDFAVCSTGTGTLGTTIGLNNGSGNFSTRSVAQENRSYDAVLADVDGDGDPDLLTSEVNDRRVLLRLNDGTGIFGLTQNIPVGSYVLNINTADMDGDGDLDLLISDNNNGNAGTVGVRFNIGGTQPGITSIAPTMGPVGSTVVVTGINLGTATAVSFNGVAATSFTATSATTISAVVPAGATTGTITVTTPSGTATSPVFTVTTPSLSGVSPAAAALGATLTLYGSNLYGTHTITFGGGVTQTSGFTVNAAGSQITGVVIPAGAVTGSVTVTAGTVTTSGVNLIVYQQPTITSISPTSGPAGTSVTITGTNLTGGTVTVRVNGSTGSTGTISSNNGTTLVFTVRSGSTTGPVYLSNGGGTATGPVFTVLTPQVAVTQGGTSYPSNGTAYNFGSQAVNTNSAPVTFTLTNAGTADLAIYSITSGGNYGVSGAVPTTVPAGGTATVSATFTPLSSGTRSGYLTIYSSLGYYYVNLTGTGVVGPALTSISPTSGQVGNTVTLNGSNLTGTTTITFGGGATVTSGFTVNGAGTQITGIVVPTGATTGSVTATTGVGPSNGLTFTVTAPQLAVAQGATSYPSGGPAYDFGTQVLNTTSAAVSFTLSNAGTAPLTISGITTTGDFAVSGPVPTSVAAAGGTATVGATFTPTTTGTRTGTLVITSSLGTYTINLMGSGQMAAPSLSSLSPTSGPVGTAVVISGSNLSGASSVSFNGTPQAAITNNTGTSLTAVVPAGATTGAVAVTTPGGTSNGLPFTVTAPQLAITQGATSYPSGGTAYGFGPQVLNTTSAAVSFTLNNAGTAPLSISSITTTGNFAVSGAVPGTVAAGGTALVSVTFTPTATGPRTGTLVITSSLGNYTVNLTGTGQVAAPSLSTLSPTSGPVGTSVTISGLNLGGATSVRFGSTTQTAITDNTGTSLTVAVPAGLSPGAVAVTVTTPGGTSNGLPFTVTAPQLAITQGSSSYPSGGTAYGFGPQTVNTTSAAVSFTLTNAGTAPLSISSVVAAGDFATSGPLPTGAAATGGTAVLGLTFAPTASGPRTGTVVITSNAGTYTLHLSGTGQNPAPVLTSIAPASALAGSTIALTGTNLTGTYAVSFTQGSTSQSVTSGYVGSSTSLTGLVVPASLSPGAYVVYASTPNGVSNGLAFTVLTPAPVISSFPADYGMEGEVMTLTGSNLSSATSVNFGGVSQPTITSNTGTSLSFAVPAGALTGPVTVTTPGGTSNSLVFYVVRDLTISTGTAGSPVAIVPGDYRNITITGAAVLQTEAVVFGDLMVQTGGYLGTNCGAVTGRGSFTLAAGATLAICDANGLRAIGNSGPVRVAGPRSFSTAANYLYDGSVAQQTGSGLPTTVRSLTVANPNGVTLTSDVAVTQTLTLNSAGNLALNGRALTLLSDASGTALVVNSGTGVVTGGTATVQRYLDPTRNPGRGYRHYSSPVRGNTLADLQTGTFTPVFNTAYNTSATPHLVAPFPNVLAYDQARVAGPASSYSGFDKGWYSPASGTSTPAATTVGLGYSVQLLGTEKVDFTGTLNTGTYALNLARTTGPTAAAGGWALVGNPYPAPIDWTRVAPADRPGLDASIYVFESSSAYGGAYRAYVNNIGSGSPLIGTAQGFWVQVSSGQTAGALTFRDAHRLTDYATQVPVRRGTADTRPQLQLTLAGNGLSDDAYLYAEAGATAAVDASFDAVKLLNPHGLNVATLPAVGPALAIDGRADLSLAATIPLQVGVPTAGSYRLTAAVLAHLLPGTRLVLVDALTNTRTVLAQGTSYAFTTPTTTLPGRFFLNLAPAGALGTAAEALAAQVLLYPNPAHGTATLHVPAALRTGPAVLLNALGQTVRLLTLGSAGTTVDLRGLAAGVYTLRLTAATGTITRRLVVE